MSKTKMFIFVVIFILISWSLISLYYYNKHTVTIQDYTIGERIETTDGIYIVHNVEILNFEGNNDFAQNRWFYESILPKIPQRLQITAYKIAKFYSKPYSFELDIDNVEGRIMRVNGIYVSKLEEKDELPIKIGVEVSTQKGTYLTTRSSGATRSGDIWTFQSRGKFFFNEYSLDSDDNLIITVNDRLNDEIHEKAIIPDWNTNKYTFFKRPPIRYHTSPDNAAHEFIRAYIYDKDIDVAKGYLHSEITQFPWRLLEHDKWSLVYRPNVYYEEEYQGFNDVFLYKMTFRHNIDEVEPIAEQIIYLNYYNGGWRVIDVSPLYELTRK